MREIYNKLLDGRGVSRDVDHSDTKVTTELVGKLLTVGIKTVYVFRGDSGISKTTQNLLNGTTNRVVLDKIEITRVTNSSSTTIAMRFLSEDDVLIFTETDTNLLLFPDKVLLSKIGLTIV